MLEASLGKRGRIYATISGMDPRADWLLGPGRRDFLGSDDPATLIPCIIVLDQQLDINATKQGLLQLTVRAPVGRAPGREAEPRPVVMGFAPKAFFDELADPDGPFARLNQMGKTISLSSPIARSALPDWDFGGDRVPEVVPPDMGPPACPWPPGTVVIGVIDEGIAFANQRFRLAPEESRIEAFWHQDHPIMNPTSVDFGRELVRSEIEQLLKDHTKDDVLNETTLYRAAGLVDFTRPGHKAAAWRAAHGTHVLDIAAAIPPGCDARSRPIIAVELSPEAVVDTSFGLLTLPVLAGIEYILNRAALLTEEGQDPLPVVICLSYGMYAGPHDGSHAIEQAIDQLIQDDPTRRTVALPSGNSHLGRGHASFGFPAAQPLAEVALPLRLLPDDLTQSSVEIWLPFGGLTAPIGDRVQLALVAPRGLSVDPPVEWLGENINAPLEIKDEAGNLVAWAAYTFMGPPTSRGVFTIEFRPTMRLAPYPADPPVAPAGTWSIRLRNISLPEAARVQAWVQRDDEPYGYPIRGRQAYFDHPRYVRFDARGEAIEADDHQLQKDAGDCPIKRRSHVNAIATGDLPLVAGGFWRREDRLAPTSAGGPVTPRAGGQLNADERKPDVLARTDRSRALAGILASGTADGSRVAFSGTSVAAPQLARMAAERLGKADSVSRAAIRDDVVGGNPAPDDEREGWGKI